MTRLVAICGLLLLPHTPRHPLTISPAGVGAARIGMRLPELNRAVGERLHSTPAHDPDQLDCFYANAQRYPGVNLMILHGRLGRVDVTEPGTLSDHGIGVGDSLAKVRAAYGLSLQIAPHDYDNENGRYLTWHRGGLGIRYETDRDKVTSFYAGTDEAIAFIEGCS